MNKPRRGNNVGKTPIQCKVTCSPKKNTAGGNDGQSKGKEQMIPNTPSLLTNESAAMAKGVSLIVPQDPNPPKGIMRKNFVYREEKIPCPGVTFGGPSPQAVGYVLRQPTAAYKALKKATQKRDIDEEELAEKKALDRIIKEILKLQAFEIRCNALSDKMIVEHKLKEYLSVADRDMEKKRNKLRDQLLHEEVSLLRRLTAESQTRDETILKQRVEEMLALKKRKDDEHTEKVKNMLKEYKDSLDYDNRDKKLEEFRAKCHAALLEQIKDNKIRREREEAIEKAFMESFMLDPLPYQNSS